MSVKKKNGNAVLIGVLTAIVVFSFLQCRATTWRHGGQSARFFDWGTVMSGEIVKEVRELGSFTTLDLGDGVPVTLIKSENERVEVETRKDYLHAVITRNPKDRLVIRKKGWFTDNDHLRVTVYYNHLEHIEAFSGAQVRSPDPIVCEKLNIDCSSAAHVNLNVETNTLTCSAASSAKLILSGTSTEAKFTAEESARIDASELTVTSGVVRSETASVVKLGATETLEVDALSSSIVRYKGEPTFTKRESSGNARIAPAD